MNSSFTKTKQTKLLEALTEKVNEDSLTRKCDKDAGTKTIYEILAYELRNIENGLEYLVHVATQNLASKKTLIKFNPGFQKM